MADEHAKYLKIMSARAKTIQTTLDLWMKGNIKVLIHHLKTYKIHDIELTFMWLQMY